MEKKKVIIDITKPEDIDNVKRNQWMRFTCKNCGEDTLFKFATFERINGYKRMLCKKCGIKQTCLKKYGVDNPSQLPEFQEKIKETNLKKYGVKHPAQSPKILEKAKQTNLKKYGVEYPSQLPEFQEKYKQTIFEKYGVEHPLQSPKILEKAKQTIFEKYGVKHPAQSPKILEKAKQTNLKKYGVDNPAQLPEFQEKYKQTNLKKYGVEYPSQLPEFQEKYKQTIFEKYGVEHPLQSPKILERTYCKYDYFGVAFDSSWELYYYIYQTKILNVNCIRNYGEVYYEYTVNDKLHRYIPDFINESKIVEIKGDHLIDNDNNLVDFYKKTRDKDILLAKTQCMLDNVDMIITRKEITPMIKEVKRLFGAHYVDQFKINKGEEDIKAS